MKKTILICIIVFFSTMTILYGKTIECEHPGIEFKGKCYLPHELDKAEAEAEKKVEIEKKTEAEKKAEEARIAEEKRKKEKLIKKNFTNKKDGVLWSNRSSATMDHSAAMEYCKNLGGKLPSISELRKILTMCPPVESEGACKVTNSCLHRKNCRNSACNGCPSATGGRYSLFGDAGWFWSSSLQTDDSNKAWYINFNQGHIDTENLKAKGNVRCVANN